MSVLRAGSLAAGQAEVDSHLEMGRKLLAAGQLAEALSHYHSAVGEFLGYGGHGGVWSHRGEDAGGTESQGGGYGDTTPLTGCTGTVQYE